MSAKQCEFCNREPGPHPHATWGRSPHFHNHLCHCSKGESRDHYHFEDRIECSARHVACYRLDCECGRIGRMESTLITMGFVKARS